MDDQDNQGGQMNVGQYLTDLNFPADKQQIISHVQQKGVPGDVMRMLQMLPEKEYQNIGEVTEVLEGGEKGGEGGTQGGGMAGGGEEPGGGGQQMGE